MSVLLLLIGFSILIAGGFLAAFLWSVNDGQYEDDYTPSVRILFEETPAKATTELKPTVTKKLIDNTENLT